MDTTAPRTRHVARAIARAEGRADEMPPEQPTAIDRRLASLVEARASLPPALDSVELSRLQVAELLGCSRQCIDEREDAALIAIARETVARLEAADPSIAVLLAVTRNWENANWIALGRAVLARMLEPEPLNRS